MVEWNSILQRREYAPEEPDKLVVNLIPILRRKNAKRILDLGCGAGRHVLYFAEKNFEAYGIDVSDTAIKKTKERLEERKLKSNAELVKGDMKALPYTSSCFDAVICINTIYHQRKREMEKTISEIFRTLKKGGIFLANFHSKRSSRYGKGIKVEEDTFIDEHGPEKGVLHHYIDEKELKVLLRNFRKVELKIEEEKINNYLRSRIIAIAEK